MVVDGVVAKTTGVPLVIGTLDVVVGAVIEYLTVSWAKGVAVPTLLRQGQDEVANIIPVGPESGKTAA